MKVNIILLLGAFLTQSTSALAAFAECDKVLNPVTADSEALTLIKGMHESKEYKFSS